MAATEHLGEGAADRSEAVAALVQPGGAALDEGRLDDGALGEPQVDPGASPEERTVPAGRRLHPLSPLLDLFDRNLLAPGVVALGSGGVRILAGAIVLLGLVRALAWSRRTYALDDGILRVRSGVLSRNEQLVPCDRVQQVNLVQKLRHRILGVATLRVEVAGGGRGSGVALDVLSTADAVALRDVLLAAKAEAVASAPATDAAGSADGSGAVLASWVPAAWPVARLSNRQLVLAGLTGSELLVLFAFAASALQLVGEVPRLLPSTDGLEGGGLGLGGLAPLVTALIVVVFVAVWLGSAVATSVFRDAGYALDLVGDELHLSRGLLDRKEAVLPLARVQAVQLTANPLRRALRATSVRIQSAGAGTDQEDRKVSIPLLDASQVTAVLDLLLPGSGAVPALEPAPPVARRRAIVRATWPVAVVASSVAILVFPVGLAALVLVPVAAAFGELSYRGLGHATGPGHLMTRSGALVRRTVVVPTSRAQSARVRSSPLQRRLDLATCVVDIAGPGRRPTVLDVARPTARAVQDHVIADSSGQ